MNSHLFVPSPHEGQPQITQISQILPGSDGAPSLPAYPTSDATGISRGRFISAVLAVAGATAAGFTLWAFLIALLVRPSSALTDFATSVLLTMTFAFLFGVVPAVGAVGALRAWRRVSKWPGWWIASIFSLIGLAWYGVELGAIWGKDLPSVARSPVDLGALRSAWIVAGWLGPVTLFGIVASLVTRSVRVVTWSIVGGLAASWLPALMLSGARVGDESTRLIATIFLALPFGGWAFDRVTRRNRQRNQPAPRLMT